MIHAYDEIYLDDAMETLGEAVEYASLFNQMDGQEFLDLYVICGIADEFGKGNVIYIRYVRYRACQKRYRAVRQEGCQNR